MRMAVLVVVVVVAGGVATGLGAAQALAQETALPAAPVPSLDQRDELQVPEPAVDPAPRPTQVGDQQVRPIGDIPTLTEEYLPAPVIGNGQGIVWPFVPLYPFVMASDTSPSAVAPTTTIQGPTVPVAPSRRTPQIPEVKIPEIKVVVPPPTPFIGTVPASRAPVSVPSYSFPSPSGTAGGWP